METRVTRLETEFTYVRRDLDEIKEDMKDLRAEVRDGMDGLRADLRSLSARLAEKPGKGFVIGTVIAIFGLCAGMVGATVATLQVVQGAL